MNRRELVLNALNNRPVDRVPVSFWFHFVSEEEKRQGLARPELIERNVDGHRRYCEAVQPDFIKIMSDGYFGYPAGDEQAPLIRNPDDFERLQPISIDHPWIRGQIALVRRVTALQPDTMYFYNVFGPLTVLKHLAGPKRVIEWLKTAPEKTAAVLMRMARGIALQAERVIQAGGADGIYLSVQNPDITRISDGEYHAIVSPADRFVLDIANQAAGNNILHICGFEGCKNHLEAWTDYPAKAYSVAVNVEGVSLGECKRIFGGAAIIGGFANTKDSPLYRGSRAEVEGITGELLAGAGTQGILLGADCSVPADLALERLDWIRWKAASHRTP